MVNKGLRASRPDAINISPSSSEPSSGACLVFRDTFDFVIHFITFTELNGNTFHSCAVTY